MNTSGPSVPYLISYLVGWERGATGVALNKGFTGMPEAGAVDELQVQQVASWVLVLMSPINTSSIL